MDNTVRAVCVYCASGTPADPVFTEAAAELGALLGGKHLRVINGAGATGLMRTLSDAVIAAGGTACGVIPRFMVENGWGYDGLSEVIEVETMHERKKRMADMSDAAVALPGGYGTMEELLEIITWKQLGLYRHPVVILNANRYYDPLLEMFRRAVDTHFIRPPHTAVWKEARTPGEVIQMIYSEEAPVFRHCAP
ncbi:MAG: TIGR00730 family Rossman fold protein [Tannerella sp.]|nr:TIGR00730 family Rossman fold protein [Tannerella sp.]